MNTQSIMSMNSQDTFIHIPDIPNPLQNIMNSSGYLILLSIKASQSVLIGFYWFNTELHVSSMRQRNNKVQQRN